MPFHRKDFRKPWHLDESEMKRDSLYNDVLLSICEDILYCGLGLIPEGWIDGIADGMARLDMCADDSGDGSIPHEGLFTFHGRQDAFNACISEEIERWR